MCHVYTVGSYRGQCVCCWSFVMHITRDSFFFSKHNMFLRKNYVLSGNQHITWLERLILIDQQSYFTSDILTFRIRSIMNPLLAISSFMWVCLSSSSRLERILLLVQMTWLSSPCASSCISHPWLAFKAASLSNWFAGPITSYPSPPCPDELSSLFFTTVFWSSAIVSPSEQRYNMLLV